MFDNFLESKVDVPCAININYRAEISLMETPRQMSCSSEHKRVIVKIWIVWVAVVGNQVNQKMISKVS